MRVKFSKFERVAGLFVLSSMLGAAALMGVAAVKKGWFARKVPLHTRVMAADGLRPGTPVTISGIQAGDVTSIELLAADDIVVHFQVLEKFQSQIKTDSVVQVVRPFVIGDKAIEVTVGSPEAESVKSGDLIPAQATMDVMDLMSGKKLGPFLGSIEGLMRNISTLLQAFADPKRTEAFVKMFDRMEPLIVNLNSMAKDVTKLTGELNIVLPQIREESPKVGKELAHLVSELNNLTTVLQPAIKEIGPELPRASRRAVEALDQVVITLKAMQKSFLLRGKVEDVKEEESERQRKPAQQ